MERSRVRNAREEHWLAEAADALLQAEIVVSQADATAAGAWVALGELHARIALLRWEVDRHLSSPVPRRRDLGPEWMELSAWS